MALCTPQTRAATECFGGRDVEIPTPPERAHVKELFLSTLVHELAHAYERAHRVRRGRWRMDDMERVETYAETMEATWVRTAVRPYLRARMTRS